MAHSGPHPAAARGGVPYTFTERASDPTATMATKRGQEPGETGQRVLDAAERLFLEHGYKAVTLKHVADAVGVRTASLYYYAEGGKDDLYRQAMARVLGRHAVGIRAALAAADPGVEAQLNAAAEWLLSQPPLNVIGVLTSDLHAVPQAQAGELAEMIFEAMMEPVAAVIRAGIASGDLRSFPQEVLAGTFFSAMNAVQAIGRAGKFNDTTAVARSVVDVLLGGMRARAG